MVTVLRLGQMVDAQSHARKVFIGGNKEIACDNLGLLDIEFQMGRISGTAQITRI